MHIKCLPYATHVYIYIYNVYICITYLHIQTCMARQHTSHTSAHMSSCSCCMPDNCCNKLLFSNCTRATSASLFWISRSLSRRYCVCVCACVFVCERELCTVCVCVRLTIWETCNRALTVCKRNRITCKRAACTTPRKCCRTLFWMGSNVLEVRVHITHICIHVYVHGHLLKGGRHTYIHICVYNICVCTCVYT